MIITREKMTIRKIILKEWMKEEEIIHSTSEEKKRVEYHYDCMQFFGTLPGTNRLPNEIVAVEGESRKPEFSNAIFLSRNEKYTTKSNSIIWFCHHNYENDPIWKSGVFCACPTCGRWPDLYIYKYET